MGDARGEALRVDFDSRIKLEFHGAAITSHAGLVTYRELDEALSLTEIADEVLRDSRHGKTRSTSWSACCDKPGRRTWGRALYNDDHGPAGVAGRGQMGNVS